MTPSQLQGFEGRFAMCTRRHRPRFAVQTLAQGPWAGATFAPGSHIFGKDQARNPHLFSAVDA